MTDKYAELREALANLPGPITPEDNFGTWKKRRKAFFLQAQQHTGALLTERDALRKSLSEAAQSMETISREAGRGEYMRHIDEVRGFAHSRATAAHAALQQGEQQ